MKTNILFLVIVFTLEITAHSGKVVQKFATPYSNPSGLTFDGKNLWLADYKADKLSCINSLTGEVIREISSPGFWPTGLAWDGKYLWNVDYQTDQIYKIIRQDSDTYKLDNTRKAKVTFTHEITPYGQGKIKNLDVYIAIPENLPQQKIINMEFQPGNYTKVKDKWSQEFAHLNYKDVKTETKIQSIMTVNCEVSDIDYFIFPDKCGTVADIPEDIRTNYTSNESKYQLDDKFIQDLSRKVVGEENNTYWIARKIFDYVRSTLEYKLEGGWNVAPVVLQRGTGSCSEYTFSFIALCRAAGLPARYVGSIVVRGDDASMDEVYHRWPEIYLPNYGWIPIDPQGGDKPLPRDRAMNIGHLSNRFLITTQGGGDSEFIGWYYNSFETYQTDPQIKVNIETFGEWEPLEKE